MNIKVTLYTWLKFVSGGSIGEPLRADFIFRSHRYNFKATSTSIIHDIEVLLSMCNPFLKQPEVDPKHIQADVFTRESCTVNVYLT